MTPSSLLLWAEETLAQAGIPTPRVDAEWMLVHVLACTRSELVLQASPSADQIKTYQSLVKQRATRMPLQHVLGTTEFYGLPFETTPHALIPRPDTETLVETVVEQFKHHPAPNILEIGTGSGCIAIALAHTLPRAQVISLDISTGPLHLAKRNAYHNGVTKRTRFVQSNLLTGLAPCAHFDAIVSNPPYIPTAHIGNLAPEVRDFDPHLALDGGADGLDFYRHIIPQSLPHLNPQGMLFLEMGHDQATAIEHIFLQTPQWGPTNAHRDLAGHTRVLVAQKQK